MGGEGYAMFASTSLKNNRSLLKTRKGKLPLGGSYANMELKEFPKATDSQLEEIKKQIKEQNEKSTINQIILLIILSVTLFFGFLYFLN